MSAPQAETEGGNNKRASSINDTGIDMQIDLDDDDLNVNYGDDGSITTSKQDSHDSIPNKANKRTPQFSISIKGAHHAENSRISFADYTYDPNYSIINMPRSHSVLESQIDGEDEEEEEEDEIEDEEGDDEYETEEEEDGSDNTDPADEIIQETPSQEELKRQRVFNKKLAKEKKNALIDDYLHAMKHFSHVWARNTVFRLRLMERIEEKENIIKKYFHHEIYEQSRTKEAENIKALHTNDNCAAYKANKKDGTRISAGSASEKGKRRKKSKQRKGSHRVARFSSTGDNNDRNHHLRRHHINVPSGGIPNVSINTLEKSHDYNIKPLLSKEELIRLSQDEAKERRKSSRAHRYGRRLIGFSFLRSKYFIDETFQTKRRNTDLMGLNLGQFANKNLKVVEGKGPRPHSLGLPIITKSNKRSRGSMYKSLKNLMTGSARKRTFEVSREAHHLAKSKARMSLDKDNQVRKIRLESDPVDPSHLNQFKFEFADPRLTAKQATTKLRAELLNMLEHRQIPTSQLQWPLEIKGINFNNQNPYGRVSINYTRPSHSEREHSHTAYRILLTNIAYLRQKERKMITVHKENMVEMEAQRETLLKGLQTLYNEITEGLRIWASVSGSSTREKNVAIAETEKFIQYFEKVYNQFLIDMLIHLYKTIYATEFALRRLSISEGKGEGAELHEFKDIMRCREKLKSEHKDVQQVILKYQLHSMDVLKLIRKANVKLHDLTASLETMSLDTKHVTRAVTTMIDGMYYCQRLADKHRQKERILVNEAGLYAAPRLAEDYQNILEKIEASKSRKINLRYKYNAQLREIRNIMPMRWR